MKYRFILLMAVAIIGIEPCCVYSNNISHTSDKQYSPPLNKFGAVDVKAHVPLAEQVTPKPAGFTDPVLDPLTKRWPETIASPPELNVASYILMSATTGSILAAYNANKRLPPASITKLMLIYIVAQDIQNGSLKLDDVVKVPEVAWATGGSRMFLKPNMKVSVKQLIQGILVDSGNDATVTLAMHIAGTQSAFVDMMNRQAKLLGLVNTHFTDVMGLPAPAHYSSARDLAILARAIVTQYPQYQSWFSQKSFTFNNIKQYNYNKLLFIYPDADGLKTGSTNSAGFSLVGTAKQPDNPMRLISVVLNAPNAQASATDSKTLLIYGFRSFKDVTLYPSRSTLQKLRVYGGKHKMVDVGVEKKLVVTIPKQSNMKPKTHLVLNDGIHVPIKMNQVVGKVEVTLDDTVIKTVPAVSLYANPKGGIIRSVYDYFAKWL